jgi:hypothetical protein
VSLGYVFMPAADASPYLRAGFRYHAAFGDFVENSNPGFFGAIGVDFSLQRRVRFGFEAGVDTSTIDLKSEDVPLFPLARTIKPNRFLANFHIAF